MENFLVSYYETDDGQCPVEEFILAQDIKMRAKIYRMLELLEERGNALRMPYSEHLGDGIFEIRSQVGSNITRILYFFIIGKQIILTNGFVKKTQKTPTEAIETAKKYRNDYIQRMGSGASDEELS